MAELSENTDSAARARLSQQQPPLLLRPSYDRRVGLRPPCAQRQRVHAITYCTHERPQTPANARAQTTRTRTQPREQKPPQNTNTGARTHERTRAPCLPCGVTLVSNSVFVAECFAKSVARMQSITIRRNSPYLRAGYPSVIRRAHRAAAAAHALVRVQLLQDVGAGVLAQLHDGARG